MSKPATKLETLVSNIIEAIKNANGRNTDTAATNSTGQWSINSLLRGLYNLWTSVTSGTTSLTVNGDVVHTKASFTRPNDTNAYIALDVVSNSTSAPTVLTFSVPASTLEGYITYAKLETSNKALVARFRLHLFSDTVTAINDNSPMLLLYANRDKRIGYIDFPAQFTEDSTNSTGSIAIVSDARVTFNNLTGANIYGILETLDAYTPVAETTYDVQLRIAKA
jgi:hypothetical protein